MKKESVNGWNVGTNNLPPVNKLVLAYGEGIGCDTRGLPVDIVLYDGTIFWDDDGTEMCDGKILGWRELPTDGWISLETEPPRNRTLLLRGKDLSNNVNGPPMCVHVIPDSIYDDYIADGEWYGVMGASDAWQFVPDLP